MAKRFERSSALLDAGKQPRRRNTGQRQLPAARRELGLAVLYTNWLSAKTGKNIGCRPRRSGRRRRAGRTKGATPGATLSTDSFAYFVRAQTFDTGRPVGFYDGSKRGELQHAEQRVTCKPRVGHGGQRHGVVPGLVQPRLLRHFPAQEPERARDLAYRVVRGGSSS